MVSRVKRYFLEIKDFSNIIDLNLLENYKIILDVLLQLQIQYSLLRLFFIFIMEYIMNQIFLKNIIQLKQ